MRIALACLVVLLSVPAGAEENDGDTKPALTTSEWREPDVPLDLHWQVLALPERIVELAFTPVALVVGAFERYRLDLRLYDLLRNDAGTIVFTPRIKFSGSDGLGGGGKLSFKKLMTDDSKLSFGGLARINGDFDVVSEYEQAVANLEGRAIVLRAEYELDQDLPYYGIGDQTDQRQDLENRELRATLELDVTRRGSTDLSGVARAGYLRQELSVPVGQMLDPVLTLPPGLGEVVEYARGELEVGYDTRDTPGKTTSGIFAQLAGSGSLGTGDALASGARLTAHIDWYKQVLPRKRVLVFSAGAGAATPLTDDDEVPLHELVTLGRKDHLRGYSRGRLRDLYGWWASVEYRYPIWEYQSTGAALIPAIFFDVGKVAGDVSGLASGEVYYDAGVGVRAEHESHFFFSFELGVSPEGPELGFSLGSEL